AVASQQGAFVQRFQHAIGQSASLVGFAVFKDDDKFVAADAANLVFTAQDGFQLLADFQQQGIARGMAEGAVHIFDVVQVQIGQQAGFVVLAAAEQAVQCFFDTALVQDIGNRIVVGHQAQLAVGLGTGGDVLQRSFDALIDDGHTQGKLAGLGIGVVVGNGHVLTILCVLGDSFPVLFGKEIGPVYGAFVRVCVYVEHARQNG